MQVGIEANTVSFAAHGCSRRVPQDLTNALNGMKRIPVAPEKTSILIRASPITTGDEGGMRDASQERILRVLDPMVNFLFCSAFGEGFE